MSPVAAIPGTGGADARPPAQGKARGEAAPGFSPLLERALRHGSRSEAATRPGEVESDTTIRADADPSMDAADEAASTSASRPVETRSATTAATARVERSPDKLEPEFRSRLDRVLQRMHDEFGYEVRVTETVRTQARQDQLFAQGRTSPGPTVTWTRNSNHTKGLAADIVIKGGNDAAYAKLATIAADEGLRTLGPSDPGHVELAGGRRGEESARVGLPGDSRAARTAMVATPAAIATVAQTARVAQVAVPGTAMPAASLGESRRGTAVPAASGVESRRVAAMPAASAGESGPGTAVPVASLGESRPAHAAPPVLAGNPRPADGLRSDILATSPVPRVTPGERPGTAIRDAALANTAAAAGEFGVEPRAGTGDRAAGGIAAVNGATPSGAALNAAVSTGALLNGPIRPVSARDVRSAAVVSDEGDGPGETAGQTVTNGQPGTRGKPDPDTVRAVMSSPDMTTERAGRLAGEMMRRLRSAVLSELEADSARTSESAASQLFVAGAGESATTDLRAAAASNLASPTAVSAAVASPGPGGPDIAARVARLVALQDAANAIPATGVTIEVGPEDGTSAARIRLGLRGNAINALIDVADPAAANRLISRGDELRRALERTGLEPATVVIRESMGPAAGGRGATGGQSHTDDNTGRHGMARRDPGTPDDEQRNSRRNSKENRR
jgi:hypothetical protein